MTSADICYVANCWVDADCIGETPWGPTVFDFKYEEVEDLDKDDIKIVKELPKGLDPYIGEDHDRPTIRGSVR